MKMCKYMLTPGHECASDCVGFPRIISATKWARNELDYPTHDDVPLSENERNRAIDLLLSLNVIEEEPTVVITKLRRTDIELLQSGLFLMDSLLHYRHEKAVKNDEDPQIGREILDSLSNVRKLREYLESQKENI